jgi:kinesin family member 22
LGKLTINWRYECIFNCPSFADDIVNKTPVGATQSSPKLSDRLREISNSLKLLSTRPVRVTEQKLDMVGVQDFHIDLLEPKTPEIHLKSRHAGDSHELFKACSTGIKVIYLVSGFA